MLRRFLPALLAVLLFVAAAPPALARTVLFIGNSFTFGANSAVHRYRPDRVSDLNGEGTGGVPALFKTFAEEAGLDWQVSLETSPGKELAWHLDNKRALIDRAWDAVVLQGYSTLDPRRPGDPARHVAAARKLAALFRARNPGVTVDLVATWSRADLTYRPGARWSGQPIERMGDDLAIATDRAVAEGRGLSATVAVGSAWNRAFRDGLADPYPYDGVAYGQINLWSWDQYHASAEGYYLAALMAFGTVTRLDPRLLEGRERAADDLGLEPRVASRLRALASDELRARGHIV
ncbi:PEP-CTERM sorting domain-containing protein [Sphingomonas sp. BK235]|jgi:hypothetical protein|uniref:PEP-CTERM sorting domain-containing protein n=1 Tax=Sphingomonas sp. BK235 TaxID=2512131 RepID=UPI0010485045|nr:PEP-CTERM sorting domain-containing protein [Sphingomonas sp. BK235]TCP35826.1 hypothetical protein EV292_102415 [Sphingomonas sp. BK235]